MAKITIYTDGAARGNPGPSASGFSAYLNGRQVAKVEEYNGAATNNFAEYNAVILALEWCISKIKEHKECEVELKSDSELVVRQLNGLYKIKSVQMKELNKRVKILVKEFSGVKFMNLPRSDPNIVKVDYMLNLLLDKMEAH